MGTPNKYNPSFCKVAKHILAGGESIAAVCAEIEITRQTFYNWKKEYPEFDEAVEIGIQKSQREWERIGKDGIIGNYDRFSAPTWIFTMKNRFRADYSEDKEESKSDDKSVLEKLITGEIKLVKE